MIYDFRIKDPSHITPTTTTKKVSRSNGRVVMGPHSRLPQRSESNTISVRKKVLGKQGGDGKGSTKGKSRQNTETVNQAGKESLVVNK